MKSKLFLGLVLSCFLSLVECRAVRQAATCSFQTDDYSLSWEYDELSSDVVFKLSATSRNPSFWSGVYFGDEEKPSDVIGVFVRSGQIGLVDGHVNSENDIESDDNTNVQSLTFDLQDHTLTAEFARPLTSIDESDADLSNCVTFYFPVDAPAIDIGGPVEVPKNLVKKRVCDLAVSCSSSHSLVVKRADNTSTTCKYESNDKQRSISWQKVGENVLFSVEQPAKKGKWWTAIGVGESMQDLDLIVTFTENGEVQHTGGYKSIGYSSPEVDETLTAAHKLDSFNVADDKSFFNIIVPLTFLSTRMENDCVTVQMGILAGTYAKKRNDFIIQKHRDSPIAVTVCNIDQCSQTENTSEPLSALSTPPSSAASSTIPNNEIEDVIIEKNHQVQNQETVQEPEQELLSAENPKRDDDKSLEGSGQQAGIFETVSHELQEIQGSGQDTDKSKSDEVLPNSLETNMTNSSQANDLIEPSFSASSNSPQANTSGQGPENNSLLSSEQPNSQDSLLTSTSADNLEPLVIVSSTSSLPGEPVENATASSQGSQNLGEASSPTTIITATSTGLAQDSQQDQTMTSAFTSIFDLSVANLTADSNSTDSNQENISSTSASNQIIASTNNPSTFTSVSSGSDLTTAIIMLNSPVVQKNIDEIGSGEEPAVEASTKKEVVSTTSPTVGLRESTDALPQTVSVSNDVAMLNTILPKQTCSQEDLKVCQSYFDEYLVKVADWARRHDFSASSQQWKACKLLSDVKNVPTLCCNRYQQECANVTPPPQ